MNSFSDLNLHAKLLHAIALCGYDTPTPIQKGGIPAILSGNDVLASAQTGTGKTAAFTLPLLHKLLESNPGRRPGFASILILTPTRELAAQIGDNIAQYAAQTSIKHTVIFGGVNTNPQVRVLKEGVDILIATPGRLLDLQGQGFINLSKISHLVLDEADRMLDMGFIPDMRRVIKMIPDSAQRLMFSATFSKDIRKLANSFLRKPIEVDVAPANSTAERVAQRAIASDAGKKADILAHIIHAGKWEQVLIFTRTKHGADRLCRVLGKSGVKCQALHGNKSQNQRTRALEQFKSGDIIALVATDIAARGIDIAELPHVVNYELPNIAEDYVHRIGRTARAGREGEALSLVSNEERAFLSSIELLISQDIKIDTLPGFEPEEWPKVAPTAKEVERARAKRRDEARKNRGPRKDSGSGSGNGRRRSGLSNRQQGGKSGEKSGTSKPRRGKNFNRKRNSSD